MDCHCRADGILCGKVMNDDTATSYYYGIQCDGIHKKEDIPSIMLFWLQIPRIPLPIAKREILPRTNNNNNDDDDDDSK